MANVSCPFRFISYNSYDFLLSKLTQLVDENMLSRCACWYHESVGGEKDHFHCYAEPVIKIDTVSFQQNFVEIDENGEQQSIAIKHSGYGCRSKFVDAYLYGIHDSDYLAYKGKQRDLVNIVSDKHIYIGDFKDDIAEAEFFKFKCVLAPYQRIKELVYQGLTLPEVYIRLRTPFGQFNSVKKAYEFLEDEYIEYLKNEKIKLEQQTFLEDLEHKKILKSLWEQDDKNK